MLVMGNEVGRLIEVRVSPPLRLENIAAFSSTRRRLLTTLEAPAVVCLDLRRTVVLDQQSVTFILERMRLVDDPVEREATLLPVNDAIVNMQIERLFREAPSPRRRAFHSMTELREWLGEVLTPREKSRLETFLRGEPTVHAHDGKSGRPRPIPQRRG